MSRPISARKKTYVRRSPIAGRGLFAGRAFKRGDLIIRVKGKRSPRDFGAYTAIHSDGSAHQITNKARFLNHRLPPNAKLWDDDTVTALRRIAVGEEITMDYGKGCRPGEDT